jgi:hypothetical protein
VLDEAAGRPAGPLPWSPPSPPSAATARRSGDRLTGGALTLLTAGVATALVWGSFTGRLDASSVLSETGTVPVATTPSAQGPEVAPLRPTPGREAAAAPVGAPEPPPGPDSRYAYIARDPTTQQPIAYDPCRPIHVVVRPQNAPPEGAAILAEAVTAVSRATGLQFVDDGATTEQPSAQRRPFQPERYGDRWVPVLVAWVTAAEEADVSAGVVGQAWSLPVSTSASRQAYVTGQVQLDAQQITEMLGQPGGWDEVRAVLMHELGHLVGLDHVNDPSQLMYPESTPDVRQFAAGDLNGLALLGRGPCLPEL